MTQIQQLKPSREARSLYSSMVARSEGGHLGLESTVELGAERVKQGHNVRNDGRLASELCQEDWMEPASDGGWSLGDLNPIVPRPD